MTESEILWNVFFLVLGTILGFGLDQLYDRVWRNHRDLKITFQEDAHETLYLTTLTIHNTGRVYEPYIDLMLYIRCDLIVDYFRIIGETPRDTISMSYSFDEEGYEGLDSVLLNSYQDCGMLVVMRSKRIIGLSPDDSAHVFVKTSKPLERFEVIANAGTLIRSAEFYYTEDIDNTP